MKKIDSKKSRKSTKRKEEQEMMKKTYEYFIKAFDLDDIYSPQRLHNKLKKDHVSVPLIIAIFIICIYICIGSFLFKNLEGWSFIQACYFSFTKMATIGNKYK